MTRLTVVAGTNREGSRTLKLATYLARRFEAGGAQVRLLDLRDLPATVVQSSMYDTLPDGVQPLIDAWMEAEALVVVTPEYNGGFPGVLKLFIDLLPHPDAMQHRPVAFAGVAAGKFGALRPIEQLTQLWHYRMGIVFPERVMIPNAKEGQGPDGGPTDPFVQGLTDDFVAHYLTFVARLRGWPEDA